MSGGKLYRLIERELAAEMRLDLTALSPNDRRRLRTAVSLQLKIDDSDRRLQDNEKIDLGAHIRDQEILASLVAPPTLTPGADGAVDFTKLSDAEIGLFERLLCKAMGQPVPDPAALEAAVAADPEVRRLLGEQAALRSVDPSPLKSATEEFEARRLALDAERERSLALLKRAELAESELERVRELAAALSKLNADLEERLGLYRKLFPDAAAKTAER
jgi:hypothetical protein